MYWEQISARVALTSL